MKRELFYDDTPMNTTSNSEDIHDRTPSTQPEEGNRDNMKLPHKAIEFNMKKDESVEMFGRMVEQFHARGIVFTILQDYNLIWICL